LKTTGESIQIIGKKTTLANKMLCFVVRGMTTKYTIRAIMSGGTKETAEALKFTAKNTAECITYLLEKQNFSMY
jgi:hypothetical protein